MNYTGLNQELQGLNTQSKKLANNTYLQRRGNDIALLYHSTDVVTFKPNGDMILNSGGWYTSTTKERINMGIGNRLSQSKGVWYIDGDKRFADGMVIKANGTVKGAVKDNTKADIKFKAKVKAYAKLYADALPLDKPNDGDCLYCHMVTTEGQSLGDAFKSNDHIDSHIREKYIVPSLAYHALKESGNTDYILSLVFNNPDGVMMDIARERVYKAVYKYILRRKGFAV